MGTCRDYPAWSATGCCRTSRNWANQIPARAPGIPGLSLDFWWPSRLAALVPRAKAPRRLPKSRVMHGPALIFVFSHWHRRTSMQQLCWMAVDDMLALQELQMAREKMVSESVCFNCKARGIQPIATKASAQPYDNPRRMIAHSVIFDARSATK